ncbi:Hypothetical protein OINT_1000894 [Brucella intermedia LMG 3301]|uniref:Uncharacterized protein n=1 Tax=Brucella intermedia LMG 3301 TaxID=641118 RepID=C4WFY7_9HYPH|nr:Hypothetical protein OINT_1000894 [Brucella intermedia LMG 3301]
MLRNACFPGIFNDIKLIHKRRHGPGISPVSRIIATRDGECLFLRY